jgi:amino acid adenylation domain-containing protein
MTALLHEWVARHADARPDACAVVSADARLTYGELDARSNQLARVLRSVGCRKGDRVCMLMPKSVTAITAIVGIYKADCIFVPLDPSNPASRLARILESCQPRCLVAAGDTGHLVAELLQPSHRAGLAIGWVDPLRPAPAARTPWFNVADMLEASRAPLEYRNTRRDAAHILFTSGSTGTPKGVVITHANVIAFVEWARRYFGMSAADRVSGHSPLHFDLSTFDIFGAFAAGAQLHLVPPELNLLPHKLAAFIRDSELTQWFSVPSILNYLAKFDVVTLSDFPALKRVLWCGEVLPTPALMYFMSHLPHVTFTNLYGPTETTIASSYYTVPQCPRDPAAEIPIGTGCTGEELLVLDEALNRVPAGDAGQLYIRGVGVSPGYWNDGERTAAAFVPAPGASDADGRLYKTGDLARVGRDGLVYFLGRADTQIKSRGYRVELGEIEAALNTIHGLQEAAVVGIPTGGFEGTVIACAYAPLEKHDLSPPAVRTALSALLPSYMLPSRWLKLPGLPRNASGKIDRRTLRERFHADEARTA